MSFRAILFWAFTSFSLLFSIHTPCFAEVELTAQTLTPTFDSLLQQKQQAKKQLKGSTKQYVLNPSERPKIRLDSKNQKAANDYLELQKKFSRVEPIVQFRNELIEKYQNKLSAETSLNELELEASEIALALFSKTKELKKSYRMSAIPLWQNFLSNMGLKPAGECHHWTKDLLNHIKPIERKFFNVTWAESKPGTIHEHNTTMIFPKWGSFEDGLLFDPWRTGGDPFWRAPKKDKHFHWKKWQDYGIY